MATYLDTFRRHMRLSILKILKDAPEYSCNDSILRDALMEFGFNPTRDVVRGQIQWLSEQGYLETQDVGKMIVAKATAAGVDIALGRALHPDIQRPSP